MAVHAHPDDEGIQTGGVLALAAQRGIKTVLVTCTNGEMGDSPDGLKPESDGHDTASTAELRLRELRKACEALSIADLELLGYRDSGMMGWPQNDDPTCFWHTPLEEATGRVAELLERHRPDVVITYDGKGLYGHPDHIQAHRATIGAAEKTGIPQKIYEIAFPLSLMKAFAEMQRQAGVETARKWMSPKTPPGHPRRADHDHNRRLVGLGCQEGVNLRAPEPDGELRFPEDGRGDAAGCIRHGILCAPHG